MCKIFDNIPAMPLHDAHFGGFFIKYDSIQQARTQHC